MFSRYTYFEDCPNLKRARTENPTSAESDSLETKSSCSNHSSFLFCDLFAGIGGFHNALSGLGGTCVFASELCSEARQMYAQNAQPGNQHAAVMNNDDSNNNRTISEGGSKKRKRGNGPVMSPCPLYGDITEVPTQSIPEHDILCAGFPCQSFTRAGKMGGFSDPRGQLFWEVVRVLAGRRPRGFILENVKNLYYIDGGSYVKGQWGLPRNQDIPADRPLPQVRV